MEKNFKTGATDRRREKRVDLLHLDIPVEIKMENIGMSFPGILLDISLESVGLLSFKEIPPKSLVNLSINFHNLNLKNLKAKVIWSLNKENVYRAGLVFIKLPKKIKQKIYQFIQTYKTEDF